MLFHNLVAEFHENPHPSYGKSSKVANGRW
jgi:hypothetical protein